VGCGTLRQLGQVELNAPNSLCQVDERGARNSEPKAVRLSFRDLLPADRCVPTETERLRNIRGMPDVSDLSVGLAAWINACLILVMRPRAPGKMAQG
jgi:hypothetical protein